MIVTGRQQHKKTLSLGFIGLGWIGRNRMEVLLDSGNATAVILSEPQEQNALEALQLAPEATITDDPEKVYTTPDIDGIVIATPSAMHAYQSLKALEAGKSVFCQKPLGRTAAEVREVVEASRKANKLLAVDLSYRYTKAFQAVYDTISKGSIGKIYSVNLVFHNAYGPDKNWFYDIKQSGGGCVMDLGVHLIDMALYCVDFPKVDQVNSHLFSKGRKLAAQEENVEDFATVTMLTADGTAINLNCSWHVSAGQDAVIEATFYGTEGGVAFKNVNGSFYDFKAEHYKGTATETLVSGTDHWSGRAGLAWAEKLQQGHGFEEKSSQEFIQNAELIDRIYGRAN